MTEDERRTLLDIVAMDFACEGDRYARLARACQSVLAEIDQLTARIAELESRPDPPAPPAIDPDDRRCAATGNPCGTDTVMQGHPCLCGPCIRDAKRRLAIDPGMPRRFLWYSPSGREIRHGCYFPRGNFQVGDRREVHRGIPKEVTWIDAAPAAKEVEHGPDI